MNVKSRLGDVWANRQSRYQRCDATGNVRAVMEPAARRQGAEAAQQLFVSYERVHVASLGRRVRHLSVDVIDSSKNTARVVLGANTGSLYFLVMGRSAPQTTARLQSVLPTMSDGAAVTCVHFRRGAYICLGFRVRARERSLF